MKLSNIKHVYFLGIGGIGMSALARYFKAQGKKVGGYDKTPTTITDALKAEGMDVIFDDDVSKMPKDCDLVVYTPAIPKDHSGLNFYKSNSFTLMKRSEVLGLITASKNAICVAGSHGKTTVSSMIAHILTDSGFGCSAFLGGIAANYNSNYIEHKNDYVVVEADEFDRSFHSLAPDMAVITSVDTDHLDIYGSKEKIDEAFLEFANKISEEGFLVIKEGQTIQDKLPLIDKAFYSFANENSDVYCSKYWVVDGGTVFNIMYFGKEYTGFRLNIGGLHNVENAIASFVIAMELRIDSEKIKRAFASFKGIKRRFETIVKKDNCVYIDDYAHHPEELKVFLEGVRAMYPKQKITVAFQPHLFSRTKDLCEGFAESLRKADRVILLDIYPAREKPMEGVTSDLIFDKIKGVEKIKSSKAGLVDVVKSLNDIEVFLTVGAGDIDSCVSDLKEILEQKFKV